MVDNTVLKSVFIVFVLLVVLCGNIRLLRQFRSSDELEKSLKRMMKLLVISGFLSDVINLVSLLIATSSGGWPFGLQSCEVIGFFASVQIAAANWIIALATAERLCMFCALLGRDIRYVILLVHSGFSTIFSTRNLQILVTGLYLLVLVTATGPFYGFGEYTYLRGFLKLTVTANVSYPLERKFHQRQAEIESIYHLFSHLRKSAFVSPAHDALAAIAFHLETGYDVIVKRSKWLPHGILFYIRAVSEDSLTHFMSHYKTIMHNISQITFIDDIAETLHIPEAVITADVDSDSYQTYRNIYMPIQNMGLCSADFTSPNIHSSVWTGFFVLVSFVLPYVLTLTCLCVIYMRSMRFAYTDKQITENDIKATNSICTVAIFTCFISMFYDVVILAAGDWVEVSPELVYWASFVMSTRSIVLLVVLNMTMCTSTCKIRNIFRNCGVYSHDGISCELSEIEFTRTSSLSHDENGRGCRPYL